MQRIPESTTLALVASVLLGTAASNPACGFDAAAGKVSDRVYEELADSTDDSVYVIVLLEAPDAREQPDLARRRAVITDTQRRVLDAVADDFEPVYQFDTIPAMTGRIRGASLDALARHALVRRIGVDQRIEAQLASSVPAVQADLAHQLGYTGRDVTIAVLDTGIDASHPHLATSVAPGAFHFLFQGSAGAGAADNNGHGTNVCGIITSDDPAAPGVAPDAGILAVKVLDAQGIGWVTDWAAGVNYVVSQQCNYHNLCAINMSLGTSTLYEDCPCDGADEYTMLMGLAVDAAHAAGITTFASSGNAGACGLMSSPACLQNAIAVAATYDAPYGPVNSFECTNPITHPDLVTCFSNQSFCNELAAPGYAISATALGGGTSTYTGTSQAAPHAAGVAAIMCEYAVATGRTLDADLMRVHLSASGVPADPGMCNFFPPPQRVDAYNAIQSLGANGWQESFDCYPAGSLADHAGWIPWNGAAAAAQFEVGSAQAQSPAQSLETNGDDDAVHRFEGYSNGRWEMITSVYIPSTFDDLQYFILLNTYPASVSRDWSMQIELDGASGLVRDFNSAASLPLTRDAWIEIRVDIDLVADTQRVYYDGGLLVAKSWTDGVEAGGALNIAAVNIYGAGSAHTLYWDSMVLQPFVTPPCPNDIDGSGAVDFGDLVRILNAWGVCPGCPEDLDGDGIVGFTDLVAILTEWGPCTSGSSGS